MFPTSQSRAVLLHCSPFTIPLPAVCLVLSFSLKTRAWSHPPGQYSLNQVSRHWISHSCPCTETLRCLAVGSSTDQGSGSHRKGSTLQDELFPGCKHLPELKRRPSCPKHHPCLMAGSLPTSLLSTRVRGQVYCGPQLLPLPQNRHGVVCVHPQASLGGFES